VLVHDIGDGLGVGGRAGAAAVDAVVDVGELVGDAVGLRVLVGVWHGERGARGEASDERGRIATGGKEEQGGRRKGQCERRQEEGGRRKEW
jgi:hypothetical protein